jgi:hypothetical protein
MSAMKSCNVFREGSSEAY